jgi:hypothetical protein
MNTLAHWVEAPIAKALGPVDRHASGGSTPDACEQKCCDGERRWRTNPT